MLEPHEKDAFDGLVFDLNTDEHFARRVERLARPHGLRNRILAGLLWTAAPVMIILGGWTGLFIAVTSCAYGSYLLAKPVLLSASGPRSASRKPRHTGCE